MKETKAVFESPAFSRKGFCREKGTKVVIDKTGGTANGLFDIDKPPLSIEEVHAIEADVNYELYLQEYRCRLEEALKRISEIRGSFSLKNQVRYLYEEHYRLATVHLCNLRETRGENCGNDNET